MKQKLLFLFLFVALSSWAQNVNIPDTNFKSYLLGNTSINTNGDGEISVAEAEGVTFLYVNNKEISDLTGIAAFTNLTSLSCGYNNLSSLDISANTRLTSLFCSSNNLSVLDVSVLSNLTFLSCERNNLSDLNVSLNTSLTRLSCYRNNLSELDLSTNIKLTYLDTGNNPNLRCVQVKDVAYSIENWLIIPQELNLSVDCYFGETPILDVNFEQALIDLGHDDVLDGLVLNVVIQQITSLDISNKNIESLIGINAFGKLEVLNCSNNNLSFIDLSANSKLNSLDCSNNKLSFLNTKNGIQIESFNAVNNRELLCVQVYDTAYSIKNWVEKDAQTSFDVNCGLTVVSDKAFEQTLIDLSYDDVLDGYISNDKVKDVQILNIDNDEISSLDGIEAFTSLLSLYFKGNVVVLNLSSNKKLKVVHLESMKLQTLEVSACIVLEELNTYTPAMSFLDLTNNLLLNSFYLNNSSDNDLTVDLRNGMNKEIKIAINVCAIKLCIQVDDPSLYEGLICASVINRCSLEIDLNSIQHINTRAPVTSLTAPYLLNGNSDVIITNNVTFPIIKKGLTTVVWLFEDSFGHTKSIEQYIVINDPNGFPIDEIVIGEAFFPSYYIPCIDKEVTVNGQIVGIDIIDTTSTNDYSFELLKILEPRSFNKLGERTEYKLLHYYNFFPDFLVFSDRMFDYDGRIQYPFVLKIIDKVTGDSELRVLEFKHGLPENLKNLKLSQNSILENTTLNTAVLSLDPIFIGANREFTYTLSGDGTFTLEKGELILKRTIDYEKIKYVNFSVLVENKEGCQQNFEFKLPVEDVNEMSSAIFVSNTSVEENSTMGLEFADLNTYDVDSNQVYSYSVNDSNNFEIKGNKLVAKKTFDFEKTQNYAIKIKVTDQGGLSYTEGFIIKINDVNEAPTDILISNNSVRSDIVLSGTVGVLTAVDQDSNQKNIFKLEENTYFSLEGAMLKLKAPLNCMLNNTMPIVVTVTDQGGLSFTKTINISIDDVTNPIPALEALLDITAECSVTTLEVPVVSDNCRTNVTITNDA
ncbi:MAG: hypothetical protein COB98_04955, partial [Flavobacteriaceae bacterium]